MLSNISELIVSLTLSGFPSSYMSDAFRPIRPFSSADMSEGEQELAIKPMLQLILIRRTVGADGIPMAGG